jgi:crossover junction endonuclease MUS81
LKKSKTIPHRSTEGETERAAAETSTKSKKRANAKEYKPGVRSGGYAILVALYNHENENNGDESSATYMLKADLIREAQKHCDSSFTFVYYIYIFNKLY